MNQGLAPNEAALRRAVYGLLALAALGSAAGRILTVSGPRGETPFLSANDRSRWCTVRALVEQGTYAIDSVILEEGHAADDAPETWRFNRDWNTIDKVHHPGPNGGEHFYSSKPTLYTTLLAGVCWIIERGSGVTLAEQPFYVGRMLLLVTQLPALALYFWLMARLVERYGATNWGRWLTLATATWGTFLTTFAVTLNNHLPAAVTAAAALHAALAIWNDHDRRGWQFALAGFAAACTFANELPALSFVAVLAGALFLKSAKLTLLAFTPAALLVVAAMLGTNYLAHGQLRPAYGFRGDGPIGFQNLPAVEASRLNEGLPPNEVVELNRPGEAPRILGPDDFTSIWVLRPGERWSMLNPARHTRYVLQRVESGIEVRLRENWYEFPRSYWLEENRLGVDRGEASRAIYAWHTLLGHHGIFSLTPIWFLALAGAGLCWRQPALGLRPLALAVAALTLVCLGFYWGRPLIDRNYGGVSCGLRWMFWFVPLWLVLMLPAADALEKSRLGRALGLALLAASIASASYANLNPWSHSWMYDYFEYLGFVVLE